MPLSWYWATQQRFRCERRSRRRYHYADQYHSLESGNRGRRNCWRKTSIAGVGGQEHCPIESP